MMLRRDKLYHRSRLVRLRRITPPRFIFKEQCHIQMAKVGTNPHLYEQASLGEALRRPVFCVLITRILSNLDQNGLLTI